MSRNESLPENESFNGHGSPEDPVCSHFGQRAASADLLLGLPLNQTTY